MAVRAPHLVFWLFVFLVLLLITACAGTPSSDIACPVTPETVSATQIQAEVGEAASQYQVGLWYRTGGCLKRDQAKPAEWFRRAAEQGHIDAQWELGHMYDYGYGIEQDDEEAVRWTRLAAEQRHSLAARWLGDQYANFFTNGSGLARDPDRAEYWYRRAFAGNALS
ncbi:MAG: sel1 repeat family protein, partial [Gammaproteobacteria bacterium]|nr:sel1 repeat family protein [Gammaproteobacteria bacterium]